jgi:hypothetical protein
MSKMNETAPISAGALLKMRMKMMNKKASKKKASKKTSRQSKQPTNKQKAILALFQKIEWEGSMDYFFCHYGSDEYLQAIGDKKLSKLAEDYIDAHYNLDTYLNGLRAEVSEFRDWDGDWDPKEEEK